MHILPSHLRFTVKNTVDGPTPKARVVAGGDQQKDDEFNKTYAPTSSYEIIRIILAIAAQFGWTIKTADVKTAFLHSEISELLYMHAFPRSRCPPGYCFRINKSIYGLKQGAADWFTSLTKVLHDLGFEQSIKQQCVFFKQDIIISFYVDDLILCAKSSTIIDEHLAKLAEHFEIKVNDGLGTFLGIEISSDPEGYYRLTCSKYIEHVAMRWECNLRTSHFKNQLQRNRTDLDMTKGKQVDISEAKSLYGQLMHIMRTGRPDVSFALCYLGRFIARPTYKLMNATKHLLKYLHHTRTAALRFDRAPKMEVHLHRLIVRHRTGRKIVHRLLRSDQRHSGNLGNRSTIDRRPAHQ